MGVGSPAVSVVELEQVKSLYPSLALPEFLLMVFNWTFVIPTPQQYATVFGEQLAATGPPPFVTEMKFGIINVSVFEQDAEPLTISLTV